MLRYAITDRTLFPPGSTVDPRHALVQRCAALAREAIDYILIREKDLSAGALTQISRDILAAVRETGSHTRLLITSRVDIALTTHLDGVHLTAHPFELTPAQVRTLYRAASRPEPVISLSCHTLDEVRAARALTPTAILFAPVFGKSIAGTEIAPPAGLDALRKACAFAAPVPVLALGGITAENTQSCLDAGAAGIAAIRLFMAP